MTEYDVDGSHFLRIALDRAGMTRERFAELLDLSPTRVRHYCSPEHATTISLGKILAVRQQAPRVYVELMAQLKEPEVAVAATKRTLVEQYVATMAGLGDLATALGALISASPPSPQSLACARRAIARERLLLEGLAARLEQMARSSTGASTSSHAASAADRSAVGDGQKAIEQNSSTCRRGGAAQRLCP